jgi:hypothetical protein
VAVRFADIFRLTKEELCELEQHLRRLVHEANELVEETFPVERSWELLSGPLEKRRTADYTTERAQWDARYDGSFTYLRLNDSPPWESENQDGRSWGTRPSVSNMDVSPDWLPVLAEHYGVPLKIGDDA